MRSYWSYSWCNGPFQPRFQPCLVLLCYAVMKDFFFIFHYWELNEFHKKHLQKSPTQAFQMWGTRWSFPPPSFMPGNGPIVLPEQTARTSIPKKSTLICFHLTWNTKYPPSPPATPTQHFHWLTDWASSISLSDLVQGTKKALLSTTAWKKI